MKDYVISKQGIEIEHQMVDSNSPLEKTRDSWNYPHANYGSFHMDDNKLEWSSYVFSNIAEMEHALSSDICAGIENLLPANILGLTIGCHPYYRDFASAHIHTSIKNMHKDAWKELRQKLYNAQPLIALLSQNSPMLHVLRAGDVRLRLSSWSTFSEFDSESTSHYASLAYGCNGNTLEVRIPSSGPLFQVLSIATLIRVILESEEVSIPLIPTKDNWNAVINYGSASICNIGVPVKVSYSGIKYKPMMVKTTDLFKIFYEENKELFNKQLNGVTSTVKNQIDHFYEFVSNGLTLSDAVFAVLKQYEKKPEDGIQELFELFYNSYKGNDIFPRLPEKINSFMPIVNDYISIDKLNEEIEKLKNIPLIKKAEMLNKDMLSIFIGDNSLFNNSDVRNIMRNLNSNGKYSCRNYTIDPFIIKLLSFNVIKESIKDDRYTTFIPSANYNLVLALGKQSKLI